MRSSMECRSVILVSFLRLKSRSHTEGPLMDMRGPSVWDLDFNLKKETKITERHSIELRMDATNVMNHATWVVGNQTVTSTTFGKITGSFYGRRLVQFALYYKF